MSWADDLPPLEAYADEQPAPRLSVVSDTGTAGAGELPEPELAVDIPTVDVAGVLTDPSPPPAFIWAGRVPAGHVTLLSGHGGSGKSTLALQLAAAVATGSPLLGQDTTKGRVLFFSGEDAAPLLRLRLASICKNTDIAPPVLAESLTLLDGSSEPVLHRELSAFGVRTLEATPVFHRLAELVNEHQPALLVIDNASDTFEGSENDRAQVRGFVRALAKLARETASHPAIVLLTHTPKNAVGGRGESYSGSTAWHNSARARLSMTPVKDEPGAVTLSLDKLNVAPMIAQPLRLLRSHGGVLVLDESAPDAEQGQDEEPTKAVLTLLADFNRRGEHISPELKARNNAWKMLHPEPGFPRRTYRAAGPLFAAMRGLERQGMIERAEYTNEHRKRYQEWKLTAKGWEGIGETAPTAPTAPTYHEGALDADSPVVGAPTAPTYGQGYIGEKSAHNVGAHVDAEVSTLAETGTRADGTNPRALGTNPRALGTNPRRTGKGAEK